MLAWFWPAELAFALAAYVAFDGFGLGVGILSGFAASSSRRDALIASISPRGDGAGTSLVVAGTVLFGLFPTLRSVSLTPFYAPVSAMLAALTLRAIALEWRPKRRETRGWYDGLLFAASLVAAFAQGVTAGMCARNIPLERAPSIGDEFAWATIFPLWSGIGAVLCYALLGAGWLVIEGDADARRFGSTALDRLTPLTIAVLAAMFVAALVTHLPFETRLQQRNRL
ncbi:cytochrome d ubiquinol oxidase subunit II [Trinickia diaoshuihuensis]|uniref:cytochrome d ubiquinol oxidase subunit II n=1 Tax=Trinickia diaoshuihuensis TaxID=2292265 RepID=UPI000E22ED89|nr:cytochrome d ubiquinol oxidase subunit II [Trinickia diaoshuihuensis]